MRGRLFFRYWLVIAGLITVVLLAGGTLEILFAYRENLARIEAVQKAEARQVAGRIDQVLKGIERQVLESAGLAWHDQLIRAEDARDEFHRLMKVVDGIYEVRAFLADGRGVLRVSPVERDGIIEALADDPKAGGALPPRYQPIGYRKGSEPFATLSLEVPDPPRLFKRLEVDLNLKFVSDVIANMPRMESRHVYVIDARDNLIAHTDRLLPLRRLSFGSLAHVVALRGAAGSSSEGVSAMRSTDNSGRQVVASGIPIPSSKWIAFVEEPLEHATREAWATARRTALMLLAGLLAAVLASYFLARRLARPILELQHGAQRIAAGDLSARIGVRTGDEVEALAEQFNRMAEQLQEYTTDLERKVRDKTAELQQADMHKTRLLETVQKEREAAEQALQLAHEAMRSKAIFLAAASHDLRQPLYAISILAETLALEPLGAQGAAVIDKQIQAITILRTLFDNLLDLSRFDAGEVRAVLRPVSLREMLMPVGTEHAVMAEAKGLAWRCEIDDSWVKTDPELAKRLVSNLLANAVRYTPSGTVSLEARVREGRAVVTVADSGVGIAIEDQARIFEEFVQLSNPGRDREKGVGLGLSIVKRIGDLLDAALSLESVPGKGTVVRFELPLTHAPSTTAQSAPVESFRGDLSGMRLWVVEDDSMVRGALALQLSALGVDHLFAAGRAEVESLELEHSGLPDAVMLDDMLGAGERGLDIALWLAPKLGGERIVMVTGEVDPARRRVLEQSGFKVFSKPLASSELARWLLQLRPRSPLR